VIKQAQQTIESAESTSSGSDQGRARGQQTVLPKHAVEVFFVLIFHPSLLPPSSSFFSFLSHARCVFEVVSIALVCGMICDQYAFVHEFLSVLCMLQFVVGQDFVYDVYYALVCFVSGVPSVCVCFLLRFRAHLLLCINIHTYHMLQIFLFKFISITFFSFQREPSGFSSTSSAQVGTKC
jgi:hypothetical protein